MQTQAGAPLSATPPDAGPTRSPAAAPRHRRPLFATLVLAAVLVLAFDQLSKSWVVAHLEPSAPRDVIGSLLRLHLTFNSGAAFNLATGATWVLTLIAAAVVVVTILTARRLGSRAWALALGLLLGGALGNLSDRVFRYPGGGQGHVVDWLELPHWPIFNIADMSVVSAAVLIAVLAFRGVGLDGRRHGEGADNGRHEASAQHDVHGVQDGHETPAGRGGKDKPAEQDGPTQDDPAQDEPTQDEFSQPESRTGDKDQADG